ncbi:shikimate dehydrogenase [Paenibacillus herberti]|uniref:Shikimate dehydrogenase (NADP(+)) n=1 Tax=Paenibacillus herberti TaxID=1619309 RepID=A0A229P071_9BACL|nr:shikimate dehydrogenase [Paenibacillus herberti]OXM15508.1 shikimate dehydrogenase [Paenibacillus herberti]
MDTKLEGIPGLLVDSSTTLYGVIGDPIRQSKSPVMMNRAFRETGVNGVYAAFHVTPDRLGDFWLGVRAMGVRGVNVTIPHKLDVMKHLDYVDEGARLIGAVNTVVNNGGMLTGYNTDGLGYVRSLKEEAIPELKGKRIAVIGAGGAARGILYALLGEEPELVTVLNRTEERARELAIVFANRGNIEALPTAGLAADEAIRNADLVVNTTSIGMYPYVDDLPVDVSLLRPDAVASDLIYNPLETAWLARARERGCRTHGGLGMFIYQGAYAFEYWTGLAAPAKAMRETVLQALLAPRPAEGANP